MAAAELNIYLEQGADWSRTMLIKVNDQPVDLTDWTLSGKFQHRLGDGFTTSFTFTKLPTIGTATVKMLGATIDGLQTEQGWYDWMMANFVTGEKIRIANGRAFVSRKVQ